MKRQAIIVFSICLLWTQTARAGSNSGWLLELWFILTVATAMFAENNYIGIEPGYNIYYVDHVYSGRTGYSWEAKGSSVAINIGRGLEGIYTDLTLQYGAASADTDYNMDYSQFLGVLSLSADIQLINKGAFFIYPQLGLGWMSYKFDIEWADGSAYSSGDTHVIAQVGLGLRYDISKWQSVDINAHYFFSVLDGLNENSIGGASFTIGYKYWF